MRFLDLLFHYCDALFKNIKSGRAEYLHRCINYKAYKKFSKKALNPSTELVSVDIFDTLLLREAISEPQRFYIIGKLFMKALSNQRINILISAEELLQYRIDAGKIVYRHMPPVNGVREAKYEDIAILFLKLAGIPQNHFNLLKQVELAYEASVLLPNETLIKILYQAQKKGKKIVCLSDMYFSSADLTYLIQQRIPDFFFNEVISSADMGVAKHSGHIYKYLLNKENIDPTRVIHCGDNKYSDVIQARRSAIQAVCVRRPKIWRMVTKRNLKFFKTRYQLE